MAFHSNKLKALRIARELTQRELADKLGLSKSTIGMYESGQRTPEFETLEAICDFFNVNMDVLSDTKENIPAATSTPPQLSPHDFALVQAYNKASEQIQNIVDNALDIYSDGVLLALAQKERKEKEGHISA